MPAGISTLAPSEVPSFELEDKNVPAFTILQKDGLDSSLPMLRVNDNKTEETVRPKSNLYENRHISKSNDHLVLANLQGNQSNPLRKKHSKSQSNLNHERRPEVGSKLTMLLSTENFSEVLNAKLRKIREEGEDGQRSKKLYSGNNNNFIGSRKPFITTVKTGEFLMPPREVASLLGITSTNGNKDDENDRNLRNRFRPLVSITKRPEVKHESHHARCHAALKATTDFSIGLANASSSTAATTTTTTTTTMTDGSKKDCVQTEPLVPFGNIMFDRRVVRGSTFAAPPPLVDGEQSQAARQAEARRRQLARKRNQAQASRALIMRAGSPPPVPGRKHEPVQTEAFLEELFEKPPESHIGTQTDYFLDRPQTPVYCPPKVGQDACTQIYPGDLFDFDVEVQPILEVLVGKTIEQSMIEVLEEEELAALKEQQRRFLELRAAEKAEQQRLEEQERRLREEKDRRLQQHEDAMSAQRETEDRVAAAVLLTGYIAELLPDVLEGLKISGFLLDEIKADVEEGFMPWLMNEVKKEIGNMLESKEILTEIIRDILENRAKTYRSLGEEYDASKEVELRQEEAEEEGDHRDIDFVDYNPPLIERPDVI